MYMTEAHDMHVWAEKFLRMIVNNSSANYASMHHVHHTKLVKPNNIGMKLYSIP